MLATAAAEEGGIDARPGCARTTKVDARKR